MDLPMRRLITVKVFPANGQNMPFVVMTCAGFLTRGIQRAPYLDSNAGRFLDDLPFQHIRAVANSQDDSVNSESDRFELL
uniref:Oxidored_molyb domain-containing protein n=1 Tax=Steinernema glaseri TaxID=37863 RepID=A0A1I7YY62_9BILA